MWTKQKNGERIFTDISWIKKSSLRNNKFWMLIEDKFSCMKWSFCIHRKTLKGKESIIQSLENSWGLIIQVREKVGLGVIVEFTAPHTPKHNGKVERRFATLWGKKKAILNRAGITEDLREKLWAEWALTASKLNNLMVKKEWKTSYDFRWQNVFIGRLQ